MIAGVMYPTTGSVTVNGEIVTWRSLLVKILAQVVILVLNYIFSKLVIFKKKETPEQ